MNVDFRKIFILEGVKMKSLDHRMLFSANCSFYHLNGKSNYR